MANSLTGVTQKAKRNNWLSRKSMSGNRALEYHISNFHPDVKKQLIEKYVTDPIEAEKLLSMPEPRPITGIDLPYEKVEALRNILVHRPDEDLVGHPELNLPPEIAKMFQENKAQALVWAQQRLASHQFYAEEVEKFLKSKATTDSDKLMRGMQAQHHLESMFFADPKLQKSLEQVVEESKSLNKTLTKPEHSGYQRRDASKALNVCEPEPEKRDVSYVTYYDIAASAGAGHLVEYVPSKQIELSEALKIALNIQNPNKSKLLNMEGDSMHPTLKDKSILAIESLDSFKQDGVYVFTFDSTLYVKRLQKGRDGIKVISDNPIYDAWFINRDEVDTEIFTIHGRVTGCAQSV